MDINKFIQEKVKTVTNKSNAVLAAEKLEEAARLLRESETIPEKFSFKKLVGSKSARVEKFAAAMTKGKEADRERVLAAAGWTRFFHNDKTGVSNYCKKSKPGEKLTIQGGKFSVTSGSQVIVSKAELSFLNSYLEKK